MAFPAPRSPELQPTERLWPLFDEPVATGISTMLVQLDAAVAKRCRRLDADAIQPRTGCHWRPKPKGPS